MELHNLSVIKTILQKHNLWAKKQFGQNFLINKGILDKIIESANLSNEDFVIEIGPGLGILTQELAPLVKKVLTIELDYNLIPILHETLQNFTNIEILNQNALDFSPPQILYKVVANIPYNITSPLINLFLRAQNKPSTMTLLVQKEVAEKICTLEPDMSILSLQIALFGEAKLIQKVSAGSFYPAPKVDSAIIQIELFAPKDSRFISTDQAMQILKIAKKAFSQKRKKLSNTLREYKESMDKANIDPNRRPETLSVKEWIELAKHATKPHSKSNF